MRVGFVRVLVMSMRLVVMIIVVMVVIVIIVPMIVVMMVVVVVLGDLGQVEMVPHADDQRNLELLPQAVCHWEACLAQPAQLLRHGARDSATTEAAGEAGFLVSARPIRQGPQLVAR